MILLKLSNNIYNIVLLPKKATTFCQATIDWQSICQKYNSVLRIVRIRCLIRRPWTSLHSRLKGAGIKIKPMAKTVDKARSAETGRFITMEEAAKHPKTTVVEKVKVGPTKRSK